MTVGGMGFIPERLLMMMMMIITGYWTGTKRSGYSLTARSALFPRPQPRLNLLVRVGSKHRLCEGPGGGMQVWFSLTRKSGESTHASFITVLRKLRIYNVN